MTDEEMEAIFGAPVAKRVMVALDRRVFVREGKDEWRECEGTPQIWHQRDGRAEIKLGARDGN